MINNKRSNQTQKHIKDFSYKQSSVKTTKRRKIKSDKKLSKGRGKKSRSGKGRAIDQAWRNYKKTYGWF